MANTSARASIPIAISRANEKGGSSAIMARINP
jgi:hypothetical protein